MDQKRGPGSQGIEGMELAVLLEKAETLLPLVSIGVLLLWFFSFTKNNIDNM